ncbi:uncharacterized protein SOCE26_053280 [Sorangium cellulosum]|uniref:Uncharacterized protein n=1 Tax=Sorangium cellulosum TaxID=56 RepID=A0A2L0EX37_SORCE|nr:hypothetical protein [Sorangium cellulosum]AUX43872.1 uncharacterized protein SOCE26_053280 [Sorangium cellulosum]
MVSSIDMKMAQAAMLLSAFMAGCAVDAGDAEDADLEQADVDVTSSAQALEGEEDETRGGLVGGPVLPGKGGIGQAPIGKDPGLLQGPGPIQGPVGQGPVGQGPVGQGPGLGGYPGYPGGFGYGMPGGFSGLPGMSGGFPGGFPGGGWPGGMGQFSGYPFSGLPGYGAGFPGGGAGFPGGGVGFPGGGAGFPGGGVGFPGGGAGFPGAGGYPY